jgi:hypothetical protein
MMEKRADARFSYALMLKLTAYFPTTRQRVFDVWV